MHDNIRPAQADDIAVLCDLDRLIFGANAYNKEQWVTELGNSARQIFLAAQNRGFITVQSSGDDHEIIKIGVLREYRRQGIARRLIQQSTDAAKRCLIDVAADNRAAIQFYQALGFREIARRRKYYANGSDAVIMEKAAPHSGA